MNVRAAAVVPAAGGGRRLGGVRKQYLELAGEPILLHALKPFLDHRAVRWLVVALPADDAASPPEWLAALDDRVRLVPGGEERGDSVRNGLAAVPPEADVVLVHDAARPLVTAALIDRVLAAAAAGTGAVPVVAIADTVKEVDAEGRIVATVDRSRLRGAQTPQAFPRSVLVAAYERAAAEGVVATDCAALVERYGGAVVAVRGDPHNLKVTTAADVAVADALLAARRAGAAG